MFKIRQRALFIGWDILIAMKSLLLSRAKVAYWDYNPDKKPVIVMVHGFRGTHHGLAKIVEALPEYRIIVPDLPGFGDSMPLAGQTHSLENYVQFLGEFITMLNLNQPPILLGHSFGSIVTSHFVVQFPGKISKLVLINPIGAPALQGPRAVLTRLAIMYYWLGKKLPARAAHKWLANPLIVKIMSVTMAKTSDKGLLKYIHHQHLQHFSTFANPRVVAEAFRTSVSHDVAQIAAHIKTPTLLIVGEKDDITPLEKQELLAAKNPNFQLGIIPEVGHLIHYEKPHEAAILIAQFLQK